MAQHMGDTFPILTDLDKLTNHSFMKLSSFLQTERNDSIIAGIFTRVNNLRIKQINLTIEISGFHEFHGFSYQHDFS